MDLIILALKWTAYLGATVTVAVAAAYAAFKYLAKKWLDTRFAGKRRSEAIFRGRA
jgi:uncharacterized membrane protein YdjX (TVP38/TMEM64 family)